MVKLIKKLFKILFLLLVSVLVGVNIFIINAKMLGDSLPMPFGYGAAVVLTGSMEPELSIDDLVIVKNTGDYNEGEYVVYQDGGMLVVHEVIKTDGENFLTQGIANNAPDEPIHISQIRGEVVFTIKGVGPIIRYVQSPTGILVIFLIGFGGLELGYLIRRITYNKNMKEMEKEKSFLSKK